MNYRNFYLVALVLVCFTSSLSAQTAKLEKAKKLMKELDFQAAIELFTQIDGKTGNAEAKINLAECYRKVGDSQNAEFVYAQVVRLPEAQPIHYLYYGEMLQRNGKCDLAKEWYQKFVEAVPEDVRGQYLSKACDYEEELKVKGVGIYDVKRATINSEVDDFGGHFYKDGIIFASERDKGVVSKRTHSWTGQPFLNLYYVPVKGTGTEVTYGRPETFSNDLNTKYHDAAVAFNKEQSEIYFTRNNFANGKIGVDDQGIMKLKIYTAKKAGKGWGKEESLPFNSDEYSCAHPTLSPDGNKMFFASDMPGGFGGMDIYVSELEGGKWGPPTNLGPGINTEGHELFPFFHAGSNRLYFSSDGHLGMGGMDIIFVEDKGNNQWATPENVGAPINSQDDDFCLNMSEDGTYGFFSSDRTGGQGRDDIYSFTKSAAPIKIYVYDAQTKEPIEGATVVAEELKKTSKTGKDGKVTYELKFNTCSKFNASFAGYQPNTKEGCVKDAASANEVTVVEIPLSKEYKHRVEGVVFDLSTGLPLPGATVTLMGGTNDTTAVTDASGRYTFPLENELCYKLKGEKEKFLAVSTPDTVSTKGLTEDKVYLVNLNLQPSSTPVEPPVAQVDTTKRQPNTVPPSSLAVQPKKSKKGVYEVNGKPADGDFNGVTYRKGQIVNNPKSDAFVPSPTRYLDDTSAIAYLLHIYYDFDQAFIRDESNPELKKLRKLMTDNPNYIIEIASHTDSRGSDSYNNRLSQRRAEAVVRWLVKNGIDRDRLVPRGYGEGMTSNKCVNLIPCTEKEHQMNRRTEFRVLGCKGCTDEKIISKPNDKTKVDKCHGCPF